MTALDGNEFDELRAYIERRRQCVASCLAISRQYVREAEEWVAQSPNDADARLCLVTALAAVEVGEAERDVLDVEYP